MASEDKKKDSPEVEENWEDEEESLGPDGKAIKKTFEEIREEARRAILSSVDREKFEKLEDDEREFVDKICLYEMNSQKMSRSKRKIKLREIMLCRDVAQAYCPNKDAVGQYSEGKRILANSETGSDSVKFVLSRKICSMLDKICYIYQSNGQAYVRADLHKAETDLLNYLNRLGKMIKNPFGEAKRVYSKLKEKAGWDLPSNAFDMADDCDVPKIFFARYSSSSQLLLKDPQKPFRSDTLTPPLKLDFRIKNAVLILAGENRFFQDKQKFDKVRETPAAKSIMMKSLQEEKRRITGIYRKNSYGLADKFRLEDDMRVDSIHEGAFNYFYEHTIKNLPSQGSRVDAAELFIKGFMPVENDIGCYGFTKFIYPPDAVNDDEEPGLWHPKRTSAYELRKIFNEVGTGKIRLSMFPTQMQELLSKYLDKELTRLKSTVEEPMQLKLTKIQRRLDKFREDAGVSPHERKIELSARMETIDSRKDKIISDAFDHVCLLLKKKNEDMPLEQKLAIIEKVEPKLREELAKKDHTVKELTEKNGLLAQRKNKLAAEKQRVEKIAAASEQGMNKTIQIAAGNNGETKAITISGYVNVIEKRMETIEESIKEASTQLQLVSATDKRLKALVKILDYLSELEKSRIEAHDEMQRLDSLIDEEAEILDELSAVRLEMEEKLARLDEAIEINRET